MQALHGGATVSVGDMDWRMRAVGTQVSLSATVRASWMKHGSAKANTLAGDANGDVF